MGLAVLKSKLISVGWNYFVFPLLIVWTAGWRWWQSNGGHSHAHKNQPATRQPGVSVTHL